MTCSHPGFATCPNCWPAGYQSQSPGKYIKLKRRSISETKAYYEGVRQGIHFTGIKLEKINENLLDAMEKSAIELAELENKNG